VVDVPVRTDVVFTDDLVDELVDAVPGLRRDDVRPDLEVGALGPFQRTALWALASDVPSPVGPEEVRACRTLGQLVTLLGPEALARPPERPPRGALASDRVRLEPLLPDDPSVMGDLYRAAIDPISSYRWRFRGATPSPQEFTALLFDGVHCQYVARHPPSRRLLGLVVAYDYQPEPGHVKVGFVRSADGELGGLMVEAMFLFVDHLFRTFPLRKVYSEVPDYNLDLVAGLPPGLLTQEAHLPEHVARGGRRVGLSVFATHRAAFEDFAAGIFTS
jgi:RimJ/RimL family protein N-acetyltransferase